MNQVGLNRRNFLKLAGGVAAASATVGRAVAAPEQPRTLELFNLHTGEHLHTTYWERGFYQADGLAQINALLRDHRAEEQTSMDLQLVDLLHRLKLELGSAEPFHIISGYRSPETNAALRNGSSGVAKKSLHMLGKAVDIRLPGVPLRKLKRTALAMQAGGVGYYPGSDFVHVDVGRVRFWRG